MAENPERQLKPQVVKKCISSNIERAGITAPYKLRAAASTCTRAKHQLELECSREFRIAYPSVAMDCVLILAVPAETGADC